MRLLVVTTIVLLNTAMAAVLAREVEGQIGGGVVDASGPPLANQRVSFRQSNREGPKQLVATTDANGTFTHRNIRSGRYEAELIIASRAVARSSPVELSGERMRVTGVVVTQRPRWVHSDRHVAKLPRRTAQQLLGTEGAPTSFEALQAILKPGHQVVFAQPGTSPLATVFQVGGRFSGREALVAEVSADQLVLVRRRLFRTEEIVLTEDAVRRIDIVDPTRSGALLGVAVGGVLGMAEILQTRREIRSRRDCNLCPLGYGIGILMPIVGAGLGALIDGMINEAIYERPSQSKQVNLAPLLGRERVGFIARVQF